MSWRPDVLSYSDFRAYLRDFYAAEKRRDPRFSYGVFARRAGISWRGHFRQVVEGRRKLTPSSVSKYVKGLGLSQDEGDLFRLLVDLGQAGAPAQRRAAEESIAMWRRSRAVRKITLEEHNEIMCRWPRQLILSLSLAKGFRPDPVWISRSLSGLVSVAAAREALSFLVSQGYLRVEGSRLLETYAGRIEFTTESPRSIPGIASTRAQRHRIAASAPELPLLRHFISAHLILTPEEAESLGDRFRQWWEANLPVPKRPGKEGDLYMALWDLFPLARVSRSRGGVRRGAR